MEVAMPDEQKVVRQEDVIQPYNDDTDKRDNPAYDSDRVIHERVEQTLDDVSARRVSEETVVVPSDETLRTAAYNRAKRIIYFVAHVFTIFIIIRFLLLALGADPSSAFASFWYALTYPIVLPFLGLFGVAEIPQAGVNIFEWSDFVAIGIYYLIAWIASNVAKFIYHPKTPLDRVGES